MLNKITAYHQMGEIVIMKEYERSQSIIAQSEVLRVSYRFLELYL